MVNYHIDFQSKGNYACTNSTNHIIPVEKYGGTERVIWVLGRELAKAKTDKLICNGWQQHLLSVNVF
jgi:hypothetical protein